MPTSSPWYWIALIVLNAPLYALLGRIFFRSWHGFGEAVRYWVTPDAWSWFQGEGVDDWWAEMRLGLFIGACVLAVWGEHRLLEALFGGSSGTPVPTP